MIFLISSENKKKGRLLATFSVVLPGLEPRQAEPKTAVLPLHHKTILIRSQDFNLA